MRCISPSENYSIQVFEADDSQNIVTDNKGTTRYIARSKPVVADFQKTGLLDHEIEVALEKFNFSGLPEGVHPLTRVSVFDTELYCIANYKEKDRADKQDEIDSRLRELAELFPTQFVVVDHPAAAKPWENYDEQNVEEILTLQKLTGRSPEVVRLYEIENQNRQEVIEAMFRLEDPEGAEREFGPEEVEVVA
jgi:hypothetical protein